MPLIVQTTPTDPAALARRPDTAGPLAVATPTTRRAGCRRRMQPGIQGSSSRPATTTTTTRTPPPGAPRKTRDAIGRLHVRTADEGREWSAILTEQDRGDTAATPAQARAGRMALNRRQTGDRIEARHQVYATLRPRAPDAGPKRRDRTGPPAGAPRHPTAVGGASTASLPGTTRRRARVDLKEE